MTVLATLFFAVLAPIQAKAAFGGYGTCGTSCMMMGGQAMGSFYGTPFMPSGYQNYGQTGEMDFYNQAQVQNYQYMAIANYMNWNGAQPMGLGSYMPPMGGAAIYNTMTHRALLESMSGE